MTAQQQLLREIEAYASRRGIALTTFGRLAVNDGKFVGRLTAGKNVTVDLVERVRQFMRDNPADDARRIAGRPPFECAPVTA